jgi:ribosomal protein S18 acetylase RimI-like enzyme
VTREPRSAFGARPSAGRRTAGVESGRVGAHLFREAFRLLMEQHPKTSLIFILAMDNPRLLSLYRMLGFERLDEHLLYSSDLGPTVPMCAKVKARG